MIFRRIEHPRDESFPERGRPAKLVEVGVRTRIETTFSNAERTGVCTLVAMRSAATWCAARTREGNREERERERKRTRASEVPRGRLGQKRKNVEKRAGRGNERQEERVQDFAYERAGGTGKARARAHNARSTE